MNNNKLLDFLRGILGPYKSYIGEEYYFACPFCTKADHKKKLAIKLDKDDNERFQHWHCWRDSSHRGSNLSALVRKMQLQPSKQDELKSILKSYGINYDINGIENELYNNGIKDKKPDATLPEGFHSFAEFSDGLEYKHALMYIKKRNITGSDILKNNIGYCDSGQYKGYIIIPSYDENMNLNYFVSRRYYDGGMRYKNPPMSKNVVFNELHINWNSRIYLVEGVFDALAIRRNAIPLLGKTVNDALKSRIYEKKVKEVCICLDNDALKQSIAYIEEFMNNGINVYFARLPEKDPSETGFEKMIPLLKQAKLMSFSELITLKMSL